MKYRCVHLNIIQKFGCIKYSQETREKSKLNMCNSKGRALCTFKWLWQKQMHHSTEFCSVWAGRSPWFLAAGSEGRRWVFSFSSLRITVSSPGLWFTKAIIPCTVITPDPKWFARTFTSTWPLLVAGGGTPGQQSFAENEHVWVAPYTM